MGPRVRMSKETRVLEKTRKLQLQGDNYYAATHGTLDVCRCPHLGFWTEHWSVPACKETTQGLERKNQKAEKESYLGFPVPNPVCKEPGSYPSILTSQKLRKLKNKKLLLDLWKKWSYRANYCPQNWKDLKQEEGTARQWEASARARAWEGAAELSLTNL